MDYNEDRQIIDNESGWQKKAVRIEGFDKDGLVHRIVDSEYVNHASIFDNELPDPKIWDLI